MKEEYQKNLLIVEQLNKCMKVVFKKAENSKDEELFQVVRDLVSIKEGITENLLNNVLSKIDELEKLSAMMPKDLPPGGIVVSDNIEDLDRGHEDTLNVR